MANAKTHQLAGAVSGMVIAALDKEKEYSSVHKPVVAGVVGAVFGKLPDLLEPAMNPNHRQFFHGVVVLGGLCIGFKKAYDWQPDDEFGKLLRAALLIGGAGYISHLLLDAMTKKSLPIIGRI